jgi:hypothetical protein
MSNNTHWEHVACAFNKINTHAQQSKIKLQQNIQKQEGNLKSYFKFHPITYCQMNYGSCTQYKDVATTNERCLR